MAKCKAFTGSAVKGLTWYWIVLRWPIEVIRFWLHLTLTLTL